MLASDRDADNHVPHQIDHGVVAEIALRAEETRTPSEVGFTADDAGAHPASAGADRCLSVLNAAAKGRADPGYDEPVSTGRRRGEANGHSRRTDEHFNDLFH